MIRLTLPADEAAAERVYERYLELKHLVEHSVYLSVMLVLGSDLPSASFLYRFFGEKIYAVQLPASAFISNQKGFPVLSKAHQSACKVFMRVQARFVLQPRHPQDVLEHHISYMSYLFKNHEQPMSEDARAEV